MGELLEVRAETVHGTAVVHVAGEIDLSSAPLVQQYLTEVARPGDRIICDLSAVTFVDSTGLSVLVSARNTLTEEGAAGELVLVATAPQLLRVLEITGLDTVFPVCSSLDEALGR